LRCAGERETLSGGAGLNCQFVLSGFVVGQTACVILRLIKEAPPRAIDHPKKGIHTA